VKVAASDVVRLKRKYEHERSKQSENGPGAELGEKRLLKPLLTVLGEDYRSPTLRRHH
jgi:hypothetical protein